jgi:hypothetical protein
MELLRQRFYELPRQEPYTFSRDCSFVEQVIEIGGDLIWLDLCGNYEVVRPDPLSRFPRALSFRQSIVGVRASSESSRDQKSESSRDQK